MMLMMMYDYVDAMITNMTTTTTIFLCMVLLTNIGGATENGSRRSGLARGHNNMSTDIVVCSGGTTHTEMPMLF